MTAGFLDYRQFAHPIRHVIRFSAAGGPEIADRHRDFAPDFLEELYEAAL